MSVAAQALERDGRVWFRDAIAEADLAALDRACDLDGTPGTRLGWNSILASSLRSVSDLAMQLIAGARPVRLVAFEKNEDMNWALPWHQDRVISLRERKDVDGFSNWTRKQGVWHAEPPVQLLDRMIFARVHLDAAAEGDGCLELSVGSHRRGKMAERDIPAAVDDEATELCHARRGDVLFAKALILHRSRASQSAARRRALRIDYCAEPLPAPLEWEFA